MLELAERDVVEFEGSYTLRLPSLVLEEELASWEKTHLVATECQPRMESLLEETVWLAEVHLQVTGTSIEVQVHCLARSANLDRTQPLAVISLGEAT